MNPLAAAATPLFCQHHSPGSVPAAVTGVSSCAVLQGHGQQSRPFPPALILWSLVDSFWEKIIWTHPSENLAVVFRKKVQACVPGCVGAWVQACGAAPSGVQRLVTGQLPPFALQSRVGVKSASKPPETTVHQFLCRVRLAGPASTGRVPGPAGRHMSPHHDGRRVCPLQMEGAIVACKGDARHCVVSGIRSDFRVTSKIFIERDPRVASENSRARPVGCRVGAGAPFPVYGVSVACLHDYRGGSIFFPH